MRVTRLLAPVVIMLNGRDWKPVLRTSLRAVVIGAAAVLAAGALSACQPVKMGAAATIGDQRITTAELDAVVVDWRSQFTRNPDAGQLQQQLQQQGHQVPFDPASPVRSALYQLVEIKVWDQVARQKGIAVSKGQVDEIISRNGGDRAVQANLLASDLPARYSREFVRSGMIIRAVAAQAGAVVTGQGPVDQQKQQDAMRQVQAAYAAAATSLRVKINPRYGSFDPAQGGMGAVAYRLSKTASGTV
ncbi:MAG: hypothetical protein JWO98_3903 [Frankiales bacterium]|nr:hypothetical protein [Frankiales bacterium]